MIYKEHLIEIWVNGSKVELEDQKSVNIKLNNVLYDPTKISNKQVEYSFEFEIPCTPKNNVIFDYANNLSKTNKFHNRYDAEVYADGISIFSGTITISSIKENMYNVNLVSVKIYSLEDIFGEDKLTDIPWYIEFDGVSSINQYNADSTSKVVFPLVSYGAFQKEPVYSDDVGSDYTSKFDIDKYNKWYLESFPPSLNMLETIKKAFEGKGKTVIGDAFSDAYMKNIFMSMNLADGQSPNYNLANPRMGHVKLSTSWTTPQDTSATTYGLTQELDFPYWKSGDMYSDCANGTCQTVDPDYNFKEVRIYNMLLQDEGGNVNVSGSTYMYQPDEHIIVVPSDGFYKIDLDITASLGQYDDITANQLVHEEFNDSRIMGMGVVEKEITFHPEFKTTTPLEIQLVKNYKPDEGGIELIKGKNNFRCHDGYPDNETELNFNRNSNYSNWSTCFPHEKMGSFWFWPFPTKWEDLASNQMGVREKDTTIGYLYYDGDLMCYDSAVNPNFICGITSMGNKVGGGCASVIKNGYSWSKMHSEKHDAMYQQLGYEIGEIVDLAGSEYSWMHSSRNENSYPQSPTNTFSQSDRSMTSHISCLVYLKRNDILQLFAVHRNYTKDALLGDTSSVSYQTTANVTLEITAASPNPLSSLVSRGFGYNSESEFDTNLKVTNFLNNETSVSQWIQNALDAYNLQLSQYGDVVSINSTKNNNLALSAVDLDDRTNTYDAEASVIEYPRSMAVKYKIDTEEHGFYNSVPSDKIGLDNWKDYGDSGFTVITLNDDTYETKDSTKSLQFSYTWYDNFYLKDEFDADVATLRIPVISKEEYMIDGYDYSESLKHDGYGLTQRFWFRPSQVANATLTVLGYPNETYNVYTTLNSQDGLNLSYKDTEESILTKYFNIEAKLASNYVTIEAYLTSEEYKRLKDGAYVRFDKDIYKIVEIQGYDPTGYSPTEIKMMKA